MAPLPPWLNVGPRDYLAAGEAGARLGEERAGREQQAEEFAQNIGLKRDELAQQQALEAANVGMRVQEMKLKLAEFLDDRKQQELQNQLRVEAHQRDQNREDQKLAFDKVYKQQLVDWHKSQVETQQRRDDLRAQQAADKADAQQEADTRIAAGEDPAVVYSQLGTRLGIGGAGLSSLLRQTQKKPDTADVNSRRTVLEKEIDRLTKAQPEKGSPDDALLQQYKSELNKLLIAPATKKVSVLSITPAEGTSPAETPPPEPASEPVPER